MQRGAAEQQRPERDRVQGPDRGASQRTGEQQEPEGDGVRSPDRVPHLPPRHPSRLPHRHPTSASLLLPVAFPPANRDRRQAWELTPAVPRRGRPDTESYLLPRLAPVLASPRAQPHPPPLVRATGVPRR